MIQKITKRGLQGGILILVIIVATLGVATFSGSDEFTDRRITAGAKIFRALLAADMDIEEKVGRDRCLTICLLYNNDTTNAEKAAEVLLNRSDNRIRNIDIRLETLPIEKCLNQKNTAAIFLTQLVDDAKLKNLIAQSREQKIAVFSPFEGDVERGVQSGIAVESRVRPYVNMRALQYSGIRLKSFFLRVAKQYEE